MKGKDKNEKCKRERLDQQLKDCPYDLIQHGKITSLLRFQYITAGNTAFGYRTINHWEEKGLIGNNRDAGKGWRKFSISEITLLSLFDELRQIGFSIDLVKKVKSVFVETDRKGVEDYYLWEKVLIHSVTCSPVLVQISKTGDVELLFGSPASIGQKIQYETSIIIPALSIMEKTGYLRPFLAPLREEGAALTPDYYQLLILYALGLFDEIVENPETKKIITCTEPSSVFWKNMIKSKHPNYDLVWNGEIALKYRKI